MIRAGRGGTMVGGGGCPHRTVLCWELGLLGAFSVTFSEETSHGLGSGGRMMPGGQVAWTPEGGPL